MALGLPDLAGIGLRGRTAAIAAVALAAAGCGGSEHATQAPAPPPSAPYAYDASLPLAYRDAGRANGPYPIAVRDISYAVPGGRVPAYLAVPPGKGRLAAVVYLHGAGEGRERFVLPATWVAARRAIGMTVTLPSSTAGAGPSGLSPVQVLARQERLFVADVVAVRSAVDLLGSLPRVDPGRIGLVGWSFGARVSAVVAGVEPRIHAFVLMSGGATPVSEYVAQAPAALRPQIRSTLTTIDPLRWIARARPGTVLLQDGRQDQVVPRAALVALSRAAPRGTTVRWYPSGHELEPAAYRDQLAWLSRKLAIHGPAVAGARTGP
jgi:dienelactone hydrolase